MHPAYSVIFFTTASGAGYGLLIWFCLFGLLSSDTVNTWFAFWGLGTALCFITAGLLSSTFHLGKPERAWRAFSQWKSSWLSREGVVAVVTYMPVMFLILGWVILESNDGFYKLLAILTVFLALITVYCTGMIYASLKTIPQWNLNIVPLNYLFLAISTGALLMNLLIQLFYQHDRIFPWLVQVALVLALMLKLYYWKVIDHLPARFSIEQATGLGNFGEVTVFDPPHSQPNFVQREMGYKVARKHAAKLRQYAVVLAFVLPVILTLISLVPSLATLATFLAVISGAIGIFVERWLFFAEAVHVVTLYYGRKNV